MPVLHEHELLTPVRTNLAPPSERKNIRWTPVLPTPLAHTPRRLDTITPRKHILSEVLMQAEAAEAKIAASPATKRLQDDYSFMLKDVANPNQLSAIQVAWLKSPKRGPLYEQVTHELASRSRMEEQIDELSQRAHDALTHGQYDIAVEKGLECYRRLAKLLGPDHPQLTYVQIVLGESYGHGGKFQLAETHFFDALRLADDPSYVAHIHRDLAHLFRVQRKLSKAIEHAARLCDVRPNSPSAWMLYGVCLCGDRRFDEAQKALERARDMLESATYKEVQREDGDFFVVAGTEGNEWPLSLQPEKGPGGFNALSISISDGAAVETEAYRKDEWNEVLGATWCNLGNVFLSRMSLDQALHAYQQGRQRFEQCGESGRESLATCLCNMGATCTQKKDFANAVVYFEEARSLRMQLYGPNHLLTSHVEILLGRVAIEQGEYARASQMFAYARAHRQASLGEAHPDTASAWVYEGHAYVALGKLEQALACYTAAKRVEGSLALDMHIASVLMMQGRGQAAINLYFHWIQQNASTKKKTSRTPMRSSKPEDGRFAPKWFALESTTQRKRVSDAEKEVENAVLFNEMGNVLRQRGRMKEALAAYKQAATMLEKHLGNDHPHVATAMTNMGHVYLHDGKFEKAQHLYYKALAIRLHHGGDSSIETAQSYFDIATAAEKEGNWALAVDFMAKYETAIKRAVPENHPASLTCKSELVQFRKRKFAHAHKMAGK
jgi:tetratricopeptide (TPR) repeat protein